MKWGHRGHEPAGVRALPHVRRHAITVPLLPPSVRIARISTAEALTSFGVAPGSSLADAALLVVSELVSNAVRHAAGHSPDAEVTVTVAAGHLVIGVGDQDPHVMDLASGATGEGLRTVAELAAAYDGDVSVEPAARGRGKTVLVRFQLPGAQ
ncbi:ATP-binding protein [Streptomyces atratus]|uniref:ATP-binding protein n=1 Tax=Streptomyces atratus TaxID=1893 RepID=UPI0036768B92